MRNGWIKYDEPKKKTKKQIRESKRDQNKINQWKGKSIHRYRHTHTSNI